MKKHTAFNLTNFIKSFTLFFFGLTLLWGIGNYIAVRDILISWPVFLVNLTLSLGLGWWHYRKRFHLVFSYDESGFILQVGGTVTEGRWKNFIAVSLFHPGRGDLLVRLYRADGTFLDIPASMLRLKVSDFRFEVMALVGKPPTTEGEM